MNTQISLVGGVGRDPELKFAQSGRAWTKFPVAVTERIKDKSGNWADGNTTWFDVVAWGALAEATVEHVRKGNRIIVLGTFKRSDWKGDDEQERFSLQVSATDIGVVPFIKNGPASQKNPRTVKQSDAQVEPPW